MCWWLCTVPGGVVLAGAICRGLLWLVLLVESLQTNRKTSLGRCCPRWCYLSGLAVAGFAGGELANEPQDLARAVFCLGFLEKIGKNPF